MGISNFRSHTITTWQVLYTVNLLYINPVIIQGVLKISVNIFELKKTASNKFKVQNFLLTYDLQRFPTKL